MKIPFTLPDLTEPDETVRVYFQGKLVNRFNEHKFNELRLLIKQNSTEGFYIRYTPDHGVIPIESNGKLDYPQGLFRKNTDTLRNLLLG